MRTTPLTSTPVPDADDVADVPTHLNGAITKVERYVIVPCTSTTRPSSPHTGMTIYETNTNRHMTWNGSIWRPVDRLTMGAQGSNLIGTPSTDTQFLTVAATYVGTTNGSGVLNVPFPTPFPAGVVTVVGTIGDATPVAMNFSNYTVSGFLAGFVGVANAAMRLNYIAIGW